jgi:hypothetical protein
MMQEKPLSMVWVIFICRAVIKLDEWQFYWHNIAYLFVGPFYLLCGPWNGIVEMRLSWLISNNANRLSGGAVGHW